MSDPVTQALEAFFRARATEQFEQAVTVEQARRLREASEIADARQKELFKLLVGRESKQAAICDQQWLVDLISPSGVRTRHLLRTRIGWTMITVETLDAAYLVTL